MNINIDVAELMNNTLDNQRLLKMSIEFLTKFLNSNVDEETHPKTLDELRKKVRKNRKNSKISKGEITPVSDLCLPEIPELRRESNDETKSEPVIKKTRAKGKPRAGRIKKKKFQVEIQDDDEFELLLTDNEKQENEQTTFQNVFGEQENENKDTKIDIVEP